MYWFIGGAIVLFTTVGLTIWNETTVREKSKVIYAEQHCRAFTYDRGTPVFKCDDGLRHGTLQYYAD